MYALRMHLKSLMFQSPSGVLGVCRTSEEYVAWRHRKFQSPSGVLGVCRASVSVSMLMYGRSVSVPFRGFRGLQVIQHLRVPSLRGRVSVPFRGFRGLQGGVAMPPAPPQDWFQSPSGVLGPCRRGHLTALVVGSRAVSVPFRGFRGLQDDFIMMPFAPEQAFQSPSGVLGVCRARSCGGMSRTQINGFSPLPGF